MTAVSQQNKKFNSACVKRQRSKSALTNWRWLSLSKDLTMFYVTWK